jgi:hypothetical protein
VYLRALGLYCTTTAAKWDPRRPGSSGSNSTRSPGLKPANGGCGDAGSRRRGFRGDRIARGGGECGGVDCARRHKRVCGLAPLFSVTKGRDFFYSAFSYEIKETVIICKILSLLGQHGILAVKKKKNILLSLITLEMKRA